MTAAALAPSLHDLESADETTHVVCPCDPDTALCGLDVTESQWGSTAEVCAGCLYLVEFTCADCGAPPPD